jgi:hypothetical protein
MPRKRKNNVVNSTPPETPNVSSAVGVSDSPLPDNSGVDSPTIKGDAANDLLGEIESGRDEPTVPADFAGIPGDGVADTADTVQSGVGGNDASSSPPSPVLPPLMPPPIAGGLLDSENVLWNAQQHSAPPKKNSDGTWRRKRGTSGTPVTPAASNDPALTGDLSRVECRKAAALTVMQLFTFSQMIFGNEWAPVIDLAQGIDERAVLMEAWEGFYAEYGIIKMPAWMSLTVVMGSFAGRRMMMPQTQAKMAAMWEWVQEKRGKKKTEVKPIEMPLDDTPQPSETVIPVASNRGNGIPMRRD